MAKPVMAHNCAQKVDPTENPANKFPYVVNVRVDKTIRQWLKSDKNSEPVSTLIRRLLIAEMNKLGGDL